VNEIYFVDTTLRDGQLSLWATGMRTGMILPIASQLDRAGFKAAELISTAFFKKCVRELREDLWERVRVVSERMPNTPLRIICGLRSGFQILPVSLFTLLLRRCAANGIRQARLSDPANTMSTLDQAVRICRRAGLEPIANIIFSISPKHTDEYYVRKTREAAALDATHLCLKDPGGLLTPERTRTLVPALLQNSNGKLAEIHTHSTTGLGPLCLLEAIQLGIKIVNTAIPPLAYGSSHASVFSVARNARALGYAPMIEEQALRPVADHFTSIAKREGLPTGAPAEYDHAYYLHQVPGGMISNLRHQLAQLGMDERLEEVLEETVRVRAEFGYPIMVTPYSQFVGAQAAMNVILGERYREVTDEVIQYALGLRGEEEASSMDPNVRDTILDRPRARELAHWKPPEPSVDELRQKWGGPGVSDDDLLLRYFAGLEEVAAMRAAGPPKEYSSARHPLLTLIRELAKQNRWRYIHIQKGGLSVRLEKRKEEVPHGN
jgi:oxaloacetate decarboxylase alpha subunit